MRIPEMTLGALIGACALKRANTIIQIATREFPLFYYVRYRSRAILYGDFPLMLRRSCRICIAISYLGNVNQREQLNDTMYVMTKLNLNSCNSLKLNHYLTCDLGQMSRVMKNSAFYMRKQRRRSAGR